MSRVRRFAAVMFVVLWVALLVFGSGRLFRDPGTFWHTVVGEQILATRQFPQNDAFSFTHSGEPWLAQNWLCECALAIAHRLGGWDSVLLVTATILASFYSWIAFRLARTGTTLSLSSLLMALTIGASSFHFHARPHLATLIFLGVTFAWLCDYEAGRIPARRLGWLVPLFVLWTNSHGGVVGGLATLGLTVIGWLGQVVVPPSGGSNCRKVEQRPDSCAIPECRFAPGADWKVLLAVLAGCVVTIVINPYGWEVPRAWFSLLSSRVVAQVMDEHTPLSAAPEAWLVLLLGAVYIAALAGAERPWRVTWLIPLCWLWQAWTRVRHGPLFAATAVLALAEMLPHVRWMRSLAVRGSLICQRVDVETRLAESWRTRLATAWLPVSLVLTSMVFQVANVSLPVIGRGWVRMDSSHWPMDLLPDLQRLAAERPSGTRVFNDMLYGGFLIYHTPTLRVFIDDRCELYGDADLVRLVEAASHHPERIDDWAETYEFELALVENNSPFERHLRESPRWHPLRCGRCAALYGRVASVK